MNPAAVSKPLNDEGRGRGLSTAAVLFTPVVSHLARVRAGHFFWSTHG